MWRISRPFAISASSNENEQPSTKDTRSSRQIRARPPSDHLAVLPDAVERDVGADVEILAQRRQAPVARLGRAEQRAGLGIESAEAHEVGGERLRQDGEVALHVARREPAVGARCEPARTASRAATPLLGAGPSSRRKGVTAIGLFGLAASIFCVGKASRRRLFRTRKRRWSFEHARDAASIRI